MAQDDEIERAERIREHMNDDHADSLADYVRYFFAPDALVSNPCLERITCKEMKISWYGRDGQRHVSTVPFEPPMRDGSEARSKLVSLAKMSSVSRVPRPIRPPTAIFIFVLVCLPLLGVFSFAPHRTPQWLFPVQYLSNALFLGSLKAQQATFVLSVIAHLAEGLFAFVAIRRSTGWRALLNRRTLYWVIQTSLLGFPSLQLLLSSLRRMQPRDKTT